MKMDTRSSIVLEILEILKSQVGEDMLTSAILKRVHPQIVHIDTSHDL